MQVVTEKRYLIPSWLEPKLPGGEKVVSVTPRDQEKMGGMSADLAFIDIAFESGNTLPIVLKKSPDML